MDALIKSKKNVKLRRIDIGSWHSAVARQYHIRRLPTVWLYNGNERAISDTRPALERLQTLD